MKTNKPFNGPKHATEQRKTLIIWWTVVLICLAIGAFSQTTVTKNAEGIFCTLKTDSKDSLSGDKYQTHDGEVLPVYVSRNGKYYVLHTSKKTKKQYKHYLQIVK